MSAEFETLYKRAQDLHSKNKNDEYESILAQLLQRGFEFSYMHKCLTKIRGLT